MSFWDKLKLWLLKEDPDLPPMTPGVRPKSGELSPGTKELIAAGYRVPLIDTLRGVCLIIATVYEFFYIIYTFGMLSGTGLYKFAEDFINGDTMHYWVFGFEFVFVLLSGISVNYSKNKFKHVLKLLVCSVIITVGSGIFFGFEDAVYFGMVHFLTVGWLIYALIEKKWGELFDKVSLTAWIVLFLLSYMAIKYYHVKPLMIGSFEVPYYFIGFTPLNYMPKEFFGILPWIFVFFTGITLGKYLQDGIIPENDYKFGVPGIDVVGRNGMLIYLLHYPVVYGIVLLLDKIF